jgi:hypothetical protein
MLIEQGKIITMYLVNGLLTSLKFRKTDNAINAVFAIMSAVGFATSMGTCFFLNKQTTLQNDLWYDILTPETTGKRRY